MRSAGREGVLMAPPGLTPGVGMGNDQLCLRASELVAYSFAERPVYAGAPVYYGSTAPRFADPWVEACALGAVLGASSCHGGGDAAFYPSGSKPRLT
jgi:hypothetical protein